jgi:hypothetical protein
MEETGILVEIDGDLWVLIIDDVSYVFICDMSEAMWFEGVPTWLVVYGTCAPHIAQESFYNQHNL